MHVCVCVCMLGVHWCGGLSSPRPKQLKYFHGDSPSLCDTTTRIYLCFAAFPYVSATRRIAEITSDNSARSRLLRASGGPRRSSALSLPSFASEPMKRSLTRPSTFTSNSCRLCAHILHCSLYIYIMGISSYTYDFCHGILLAPETRVHSNATQIRVNYIVLYTFCVYTQEDIVVSCCKNCNELFVIMAQNYCIFA